MALNWWEYEEEGDGTVPGTIDARDAALYKYPGQDQFMDWMQGKSQPPQEVPAAPVEDSSGPDEKLDSAKPYKSTVAGFNPNSALMKQYAKTVQDYKANDASRFDRLGQNMPQQYGVAETVDRSSSDDEGPLEPTETARRLPSDPGEMERKIRGHILGFRIPRASREGYDNYVQASRFKDDQEKMARLERAKVNRANIADREARTMQQLRDYNAIQGGRMPMGAYDQQGGPSVQRIGGLTFVSGRMRPRTDEENAELELKQAQASYYRQRPGMAAADRDLKERDLERKVAADQAKNTSRAASLSQREALAKQRFALDERALQARESRDAAAIAGVQADTMKNLRRIMQRLQIKMKEAGKRTYMGLGGPDQTRLNAMIDDNTLEPGDVAEGDWDVWKGAFEAELRRLSQLGDAPIDDDVAEFYEKIKGISVPR